MTEQHPLLTLANAIAVVAHGGAYRKGEVGEPYINHVQRVSDKQLTWRGKVIGILHDVVEDTTVTLETLIALGFPLDIVQDIAALSRHIYGQEEYDDYIARLCREGSMDALRVKLADLQDNMKDGGPPPRKYERAIVSIRDEIERRGADG